MDGGYLSPPGLIRRKALSGHSQVSLRVYGLSIARRNSSWLRSFEFGRGMVGEATLVVLKAKLLFLSRVDTNVMAGKKHLEKSL
jgi:hypothetical protein